MGKCVKYPISRTRLTAVLEKTFVKPDFRQTLDAVTSMSELYAKTLQTQATREDQYEKILEWTWRPRAAGQEASRGPQPREQVAGTHRSLIESDEYRSWVGEGPPTLICTGQRSSL